MLENLLNIKDDVSLSHEEERLSKINAIEAWDNGEYLKYYPGSLDSLKHIHKILFGNIYPFAGKIRDVDISKNSFRFVPVLYLNDSLLKVECMTQSSFDEITKKYVEMNVCHPFREGNGRAMRIWLDVIFMQELKCAIDWSQVGKQSYLEAIQRSVVNDLELKSLLENAITNNINDRQVFMKGLDASYAYEGYNLYKSEDLRK